MDVLRGGTGCKRLDSKAVCGGLKFSSTEEGPGKEEYWREITAMGLNTVYPH